MNYHEFVIKSKIETGEITAYILWQILEVRVAHIDSKFSVTHLSQFRTVSSKERPIKL